MAFIGPKKPEEAWRTPNCEAERLVESMLERKRGLYAVGWNMMGRAIYFEEQDNNRIANGRL